MQRDGRRNYRWYIVGVVATGILVWVFVAIGVTDTPRANHVTTSPVKASAATQATFAQVPQNIPSSGAAIVPQYMANTSQPVALVSPPSTDDPAPVLTASDGAAKALSLDDKPGLTLTRNVLVDLTVPSSLPPSQPPTVLPPGVSSLPFRSINNRLAWLEVVTSPTPISMEKVNCVANMCTHGSITNHNLAFDAITGQFLVGWYS